MNLSEHQKRILRHRQALGFKEIDSFPLRLLQKIQHINDYDELWDDVDNYLMKKI